MQLYYIVIVFDEPYVNIAYLDSSWLINLGASHYIVSFIDFFTSYISGDIGYIKAGDDDASKIIGMRDIYLEISNYYILILRDVKHVPNIRLNLISTIMFNDEVVQ